jgi:hypothetical protein
VSRPAFIDLAAESGSVTIRRIILGHGQLGSRENDGQLNRMADIFGSPKLSKQLTSRYLITQTGTIAHHT